MPPNSAPTKKNYLQVVNQEIRDLWIEYSLGRIDIATPREIPVLAAVSINRKYSQEEIAQMKQNAGKNPAISKTKQSKLQTDVMPAAIASSVSDGK